MSNATHWQKQFIMSRGRYRQMSFLDSGASSDVYRAIDGWTRKFVAIKILGNSTFDKRCRFRRESAMLTDHLDNPFVVNILDFDVDCEAPYIVLEYSELGSLQPCVSNRRDWRTIAEWLYQVTFGLTIIHEGGGIVRDIKPSNLLRFRTANGSEDVKIADFGIGQDLQTGSATTSPFGTEGYIDPVAQITRNFGPTSDIFSLGVTIVELLTGGKNARTSMPGPPEFQSLIAAMTAFDPLMEDFNVKSRPTSRQVCEQIQLILKAYDFPIAAETGRNVLWWGLGLAAFAIVATSNTWDSYSGRYRDSTGRFRSGLLS